jgi:hypothetical protein
MPEQNQNIGRESLANLAKFEELDDLCPPWWPQLLWRLHVPVPRPGPGPVNYPPAIDNIMANLHIHTMSYLMKDQNAAQQIRTATEEQIASAARNLSKDHEQARGKKAA